jgi:hypothetical protein
MHGSGAHCARSVSKLADAAAFRARRAPHPTHRYDGKAPQVNFRVALCCIAGLTLAACSRYGERDIEWTETVALASGEATVIERVQRVEIHLTSEGDSGDLGKMATVASATSPPAFPTWQAKMFPILLDRHPDTGAWLLVATMSNCSFWRRNGTPTPPYWAFQVEDGKWKRVVVPEFLWGRSANMFAAFESTDNSSAVRATYAARRAAQLRQGVALDVAGVWRESSTTCTGLPSGYENAIELDLWQFGRE